jgi:microcystin-dependent protein
MSSNINPDVFRAAPRLSALRQQMAVIKAEHDELFGRTAAAPPGLIEIFASEAFPPDRLECDGRAVERSVYPALFAAIGTLWGAGDGATTFNLPNLPRRHRHAPNGSHTVPSSMAIEQQQSDANGDPLFVDGVPVMETITITINVPIATLVTTIKT